MSSGRASGQLALTGLDGAPVPTDRLFFALYPDASAAARIAQLAQRLRGELRLRGRPLQTERFHVTLHHLGDYAGLPADVLRCAKQAAAAIAVPPFEIAFDRAMSFDRKPSNRPFVLQGSGEGLAGVLAFQQALGEALKNAGLGRWVAPRFTPHVTLLYDDRRVDEEAIEPIRWTVREFVLVDSLLGRTQHVPLERWPLGS
ncbi:MAG TPA: 2'-5' RNA ligase family protein [Methylibium sp.]